MIKRIFHIADVHVRLYTREQEYRLLFDELFSEIKRIGTEDSVICVLGDVAHVKTDISPEMVVLVTDFLRGCADLCPTILIPGNHDFNESNKNKLDALYPVVHAMKHPNLHYSRGSEVIKLHGIAFSHLSIYDSSDNWVLAPDIIDAKTRIAMYHGPVVGASTDIGFDNFINALPIETFDGFDIGLLGDIHKYSVFGEKKNIAYPSSLIQQDHGENVDTHGFIVWDIPTKTHEFVKLTNPYSQYTIKVDSGKVLTELPPLLPTSVVRVQYTNTDKLALKEISDNLTSKFGMRSIALNEDKSATKWRPEAATEHVDNIFKSWDINAQSELFSSYFTAMGDIPSSEVFDKIMKLHRDLSAQYDSTTTNMMGVTWDPISLEIQNMFTYVERTTLNFNIHGIVGLFAPNRSGKSNLLDSILFVIYDKCTRTSLASYIMNKNANDLYGKFRFLIGSDEYSITRIGQKNSKGKVSVSVDFIHHAPTGDIILNGKSRDDTNGIIRRYLGTYEDFIMTTMNTPADPRSIIDMGQKDRKEIIYRFIDIDKYGVLSTIAGKDSKELSGEIKLLSNVNYIEEIKSNDVTLGELQHELKAYDDDIIIYTTTIDALTTRIESILTNTNIEIIDPVSTQNAIDESRRFIQSNTDRSVELSKKYDTDSEKLKTDLEYINGIDIESMNNDLNALEYARREYTRIQTDRSNKVIEIAHLQSKVDKLVGHEYDPNCQYCVKNQFVIDAKAAVPLLATKIEDLKLIDENISKIESAESQDAKINTIKGMIKSYSDLVRAYQETEKEVSRLQLQVVHLNAAIEAEGVKILNNEEKLKRYTTNLALQLQDAENAKLKSELVATRAENERTLTGIRSLRESNRLRAQTLLIKTAQLEVNKKLLEDKTLEYEVYDKYIKATGRDGVPYMILKNVLPIIESEVNDILTMSTKFTIQLELEDLNINGYIVGGSTIDNERWPIELASGMEKFVISTAMRSSLVRLSGLPKPNFLLVDEGFGVLDTENIKSIVSVLEHLKNKFKFILCVSHIVELRDYVDKIINVTNNNGESIIFEEI
jgi:DNA repair exonuclease SbcCD ATPase subunit